MISILSQLLRFENSSNNRSIHPQDLQSRLEKLIEGAAAIADLGFTTPNRKDQIVSSCEAVRAALSGLLSDYMNASKSGQQMNFQDALDTLIEKNRALRE